MDCTDVMHVIVCHLVHVCMPCCLFCVYHFDVEAFSYFKDVRSAKPVVLDGCSRFGEVAACKGIRVLVKKMIHR